jgi:[protein-PII] uridylyltransferase
VRLDLQASDDCLVVEAEGRDRPGLLHELTAALADLGVTIVSAHVATYGARAVDAFYLQDEPGYKITDNRRQQTIERRLMGVLADGGTPRTRLTLEP